MNPYNVIAHVRYSLFRKCPESGWKIDTRTLNDHELVLITGGMGTITIENNVYPLKQGTLLYLYPGIAHSLNSGNDNPMSFYGIHFSYLNAKYFNNQWSSEEGHGALPIKIMSEVFAYQKIEGLFKKANTYWNEKSLGFEMACRSALLEILYNLMHNSEANYASRLKIETLLAYINRNLNKKITVDTLAGMVNLSPDYLAAQFKIITGFTIIQYINQCRIDHAKIMLLNGELRIKDIAAEVGFYDEFYFSKTFKKHEGISPMNFIKNMR
jgi:AraC-like DNA-binding protein